MKYHALFVIFENAAILEIVLHIISGALRVKAIIDNAQKTTELLTEMSP